MFRRFSTDFAILCIFLDMTITALMLFLANVLRWQLDFLKFLKPIPAGLQLPWVLYGLFPVIWVGILLQFSVYDGRKNIRILDELTNLTLGSLLAIISMAGILYLSYRDVSRFLFLSFAGITYLLMTGWRIVYRFIFRWTHLSQVQKRNVLILGAGSRGVQLMDQVQNHRSLGLEFIGFLDDDPNKREMVSKVLGTLEDTRKIVIQKQVNDVVLAWPRSAYTRLNQVVSELHDLPVRVWVIPDYFSLTMHRAVVEEFAGIPMLDLRAPALSEYQRMIKRGFDLSITIISLPFVLPLMGLIALLIRIESPGRIFFIQNRVGENGKVFKMIKFRTMIEGAENLLHLVKKVNERGQIIHKIPNDPRITKIGKFLRRTSLDELPQLYNVLRGEMSLVGPRPELPELVEKYEFWQRKRFAVPQGMTGWWQVKGRSDKPMHLHTEDDLYYVQHYSIWLDLKILLMTFWAVLRGKGAF